MDIARSTDADWPDIRDLLVTAELPIDGARSAFETGVVARDGGRLVGCAAIEPYGPVALLRSVAVAEAERGRCIGEHLVRAAESLASDRGATGVVLLTETAAPWFSRLGYIAVPRASVAVEVQGSVEFETTCSEAAVAMRRHLAPTA